MKTAINKFSAVICLLGWTLIFGVVPAWSQAALLPNAKQTFFDQNGNPLSNGKVFSYVPNTQVPKTTWSNSTEGAPNANPVILDAAGRAVIYGQGSYQQTVTDAANNQQWSALTTAYGSSQPSGSNGTDTAPVGTVMAWAGFTAPTNWAFAYGQTMSRTTFATLMAVITITNTATSCVNTSTTISGLADTSQIPVGAPIEASCLPTGTTVSSISNGTSVVVSQAATLTGTISSTIFPWGNGNGTSTFTVPDLRGRAMAGADAMGGVAASRLTSTFYGASAATPAVGGGAQSSTANTTLAAGNIPQFTFTPSGGVAITGGTLGGTTSLTANLTAGSAEGPWPTNSTAIGATFTGSPISIGSASPSAAASAAFATVQPTLTVNYIIKVAANTTGLGGVTSFGGMFGDIVCASTLTCAPVGSPAVNTVGCTTATLTQIGCVQPDGTTVTIVNGKITASAAVAASIAVGTTTVTGATGILQNSAGILNSLSTVGTGSVVLNTNPSLSGTLTFGTLSPASLGASITTVTGLTLNASPSASNDYVPCYSASGSAIEKCTVGSIAGATSSGVTSLNGLTGALALNNTDSTLTIASAGTTVTASLSLGHLNNWSVGANFAGNVGIGTTSVTSAKLQITGATPLNLTTTDWNGTNTGSNLYFYPQTSTGNTSFFIDANKAGSSAAANLILNPSGGNVGIGATSPGAPLEILHSNSGSAVQYVDLHNATTGAGTSAYLSFSEAAFGETGRIQSMDTNFGGGVGLAFWATPGSGPVATVRTVPDLMIAGTTGETRASIFRGYADLRQFATLSCVPGAPVSTNVAAAVFAANTAGYTHFFIPAGCFLYTSDTAWTAHYTANTVPANFHFRGEDWVTSGMSVCAAYAGCTPAPGVVIVLGPNVSFENMFYMDASCYNLDGGTFGHPAYCPVGLSTNSGNSSFDAGGYPFQPRLMNVSGGSAGGTWNGTDSPTLAMNQTSDGDVLFSNDVSANTNANFINFFNTHGAVIQAKLDGKLFLGNTSTSHSGSGMITITDNFGSCGIFANTSGTPGFACSSDRRLKDHIKNANSQLAWLNSFDIRQFDMRSNGQHMPAGVIAQEVQRSHPEMVHLGKAGADCAPGQVEGCLSVDAPNLWQIMKSLQELQGEIEHLKRRVR